MAKGRWNQYLYCACARVLARSQIRFNCEWKWMIFISEQIFSHPSIVCPNSEIGKTRYYYNDMMKFSSATSKLINSYWSVWKGQSSIFSTITITTTTTATYNNIEANATFKFCKLLSKCWRGRRPKKFPFHANKSFDLINICAITWSL